MKKKKILLSLAIALLIVSFSLTSVNAQSIRVSHEMSPDPDVPAHAFFMVLEYVMESNTDIEVEIYPDNVLGGMQEIIEQVQDGDIHIAQVSEGGLSGYYKNALMFNQEYFYPDDERIYNIMWTSSSKFMDQVYEDIREEANVQTLGLFRRGGQAVIANSRRPIRNLEDMEGLTMRGMDEAQVVFWESLGADGVVIPWEEVYTSLQTGVAEGVQLPVSLLLDASLDEVLDYATFPGFRPGSGIVIANPEWYDNLSENELDVLEYAVELATWTAHGISYRDMAQEIELLEEAGMEVYHQTEEEFEAFREATLDGMMPWAYEEFGEDWVDGFLEEIDRLTEEIN